ncbi:sensor domain-containing protein [Nocardioides sp. zg-1228]|uniref:sensor histidine kinase n=1 Tax=Nocardioides sp. zg-1228 TaxID=2763008 RepID=UPI0016423895|nr:sensor domain-containing protein [Nocardioides sp. zg-1228]MBC2932015.1 sensor domain-containing protein [Nocardioides sp. zg-1228]QSF57568.1 sensor domain-containing protein [Nocardioides sp. zg-1228]
MAHRPGPLRLTGFALAQVALAVPTLVAATLVALGAGTAVVVVGIPVLLVGLPLLRWIADRHRAMAAATLAHPVPADRLPDDDLPLPARLATWGRDPMTWRELVWAVVSASVGLALSLAVVVLMLGVVTLVLWWFATPHLMRLRSVLDARLLSRGSHELLAERVQVLTETRAETVEDSAAELRRIERDLHDGAQARLVALQMSLGLARQLIDTDPVAARHLLAEASTTTGAALGDIRDVVRGIHPPVLADRGLAGAVQALALDLTVPVAVAGDLPDRPSAPVETAAYFAVLECLANVAKHAGAQQAWVELERRGDLLVVVVGDDGRGGADPSGGTGLRGVARRLAALDGSVRVSSPAGGPTLVTLEVPCESSSPRTTPSSATG